MSELSSSNEQNWFENVENFRPLRGGRRAGTLNEVATSTTKVYFIILCLEQNVKFLDNC